MTVKLGAPFDAAKYIRTPEDRAELLEDAFSSGDGAYIKHAIGIAARSQGGIAKLAERTGLGRQALHKALGENGNPTLDTLIRVTGALGARLSIIPASEAREPAAV